MEGITTRSLDRPDLRVLLGLAAAIIVLLVGAVIGAITVGHGHSTTNAAATKGGSTNLSAGGSSSGPGDTVGGASPATTGPGGQASTNPTTGGGGPSSANTSSGGGNPAGGPVDTSRQTSPQGGGQQVGPTPGATVPSQAGATRLGVSATTIKVGIHGPVTLDGAPLAIAADPIDGIKSYIAAVNQAGGVNGRMIALQVADDRYTVDGGKQAANQLVNDYKPFLISGTLGIDQIYQVASAAKAAGIPYMAAGGPDNKTFQDLGMYQVAANYDTHLEQLAAFLGKETKRSGSAFFGKTKIGVSALNSPYITPVVGNFKTALSRNGLTLVKSVTVEKPTEQTSYGTQLQELRDAGTQVFVPAQDPITTSREVAECRSQGCSWLYSFSDFAHDGDTELALMQGDWSKPGAQAEGLSSACYYMAPNFANPQQCAQMGQAHTIWVQQHGGGQSGELSWRQHGSGGSAGYQVDHFFLKALKDSGSDPTREKFVAALNAYSGYDDLVSGPITFAGSPSHVHGATKMVVLQAGIDQHYHQLTPGLVDQF